MVRRGAGGQECWCWWFGLWSQSVLVVSGKVTVVLVIVVSTSGCQWCYWPGVVVGIDGQWSWWSLMVVVEPSGDQQL